MRHLLIFEGLVYEGGQDLIIGIRGEHKVVLNQKENQTEDEFLLECKNWVAKNFKDAPRHHDLSYSDEDELFESPGDYTRQWLEVTECGCTAYVDWLDGERKGNWYLIADIRDICSKTP